MDSSLSGSAFCLSSFSSEVSSTVSAGGLAGAGGLTWTAEGSGTGVASGSC